MKKGITFKNQNKIEMNWIKIFSLLKVVKDAWGQTEHRFYFKTPYSFFKLVTRIKNFSEQNKFWEVM